MKFSQQELELLARVLDAWPSGERVVPSDETWREVQDLLAKVIKETRHDVHYWAGYHDYIDRLETKRARRAKRYNREEDARMNRLIEETNQRYTDGDRFTVRHPDYGYGKTYDDWAEEDDWDIACPNCKRKSMPMIVPECKDNIGQPFNRRMSACGHVWYEAPPKPKSLWQRAGELLWGSNFRR